VVWSPRVQTEGEQEEEDGEEEEHLLLSSLGIAWCLRFGALIIRHCPRGGYHRCISYHPEEEDVGFLTSSAPYLLPDHERNVPLVTADLLKLLTVFLDELTELEEQKIPDRQRDETKLQDYLDHLHASDNHDDQLGLRLNVLAFPPAYVPMDEETVVYGCPSLPAWRAAYLILRGLLAVDN
jgi:hypothetical protein